MSNKISYTKTLIATAALSLGLASAGNVMAQESFAKTGPVAINGFVSVNNTLKGGDFTDFACKIEGWGFIEDADDTVLRIDFIRPLNDSNGQIPRGCHGVIVNNYPWQLQVGPVSGGIGDAVESTEEVTLNGATFNATGQPGCGIQDEEKVGTEIDGVAYPGTVRWEQSNPDFLFGPPGPQHDNTHSKLVLTNAVLSEPDADDDEVCRISGVIKFSRWTSVRVVD